MRNNQVTLQWIINNMKILELVLVVVGSCTILICEGLVLFSFNTAWFYQAIAAAAALFLSVILSMSYCGTFMRKRITKELDNNAYDPCTKEIAKTILAKPLPALFIKYDFKDILYFANGVPIGRTTQQATPRIMLSKHIKPLLWISILERTQGRIDDELKTFLALKTYLPPTHIYKVAMYVRYKKHMPKDLEALVNEFLGESDSFESTLKSNLKEIYEHYLWRSETRLSVKELHELYEHKDHMHKNFDAVYAQFLVDLENKLENEARAIGRSATFNHLYQQVTNKDQYRRSMLAKKMT